MIVHVLNGDALLEQFPEAIAGIRIICRECLIEGPVKAESSLEFYQIRKSYLSNRFPEASLDYEQDIKAEFDKLVKLDKATELNLWFEDDLFCQANFWYTISVLANHIDTANIVRPHTKLRYGFGSCSKEMLLDCYNKRQKLSTDEFRLLNELWNAYAAQNSKALNQLKKRVPNHLQFLLPAIDATIDHHIAGPESVVLQTLKQIMEDKNSTELKDVYPEFADKLAIYGFGDLQVLRLIEDLGEQTA